MSEIQATRNRQRSINSPDAARFALAPAGALPLQTDWQRMLRDITSCGVVYLQVSNSAASLKSLSEPWAAEVTAHLARLDGPGTKVAGVTDRWADACLSRTCPTRPFEHLDISDHFGNRVLRISLTEDSAWSRFHSLRAKQWGRRGIPVIVPDGDQMANRLADLEAFAKLDVAGPLHNNWFDVAPQRCTGSPIDTSLLPPFLETLSDQLCPLGILISNRGLAKYCEMAMLGVHMQASQLRLRNNVAEFELDLSATSSAYIVEDERTAVPSWLRLFDEQGRCVAVLRLAEQASSDDSSLWRTMLRALRD